MVESNPWEGIGPCIRLAAHGLGHGCGLQVRVSDPKAKTDRAGCSSNPARTLGEAGTSLGVCPVGYVGNSVMSKYQTLARWIL